MVSGQAQSVDSWGREINNDNNHTNNDDNNKTNKNIYIRFHIGFPLERREGKGVKKHLPNIIVFDRGPVNKIAVFAMSLLSSLLEKHIGMLFSRN